MTTTTRELAVQTSAQAMPSVDTELREWIDPAYLRLVQFLSVPAAPGQPAEGLLILAHLCRRAIQPNLFPTHEVPHVARLTFRGIVGLCASSAEQLFGPWPCSRETTLKWLILLEAVTVIYRYRSKGETVVVLPLGSRPALDLSRLVGQIEAYEQRYSNKKTRALLKRSRERLTQGLAQLDDSGTSEQLLDRPAPLQMQQQLISQLTRQGLTPTRCAHIAHWFTLGSAAAHATTQLHGEEAASVPPAQEMDHAGDSSRTRAGRFLAHTGDSQGNGESTMTTSIRVEGDSTLRESPGATGIATRSAASVADEARAQTSREAARRVVSAVESPGAGDSRRQSNLESFSFLVITSRGSRFDSEEALLAEAERYVRLLDGPLQPNSKWTKGVVNGYRNCLEQNPLIACISLINTLLRLYCPLQGKEDHLRSPRKWFHTSMRKYGDAQDPMPLTEDIRSFVESPYSYEEIAEALSGWFDRNHAMLWRRPCVEDLVAVGLLPEVQLEPAPDSPPPYPPPEAPWGDETCLALFDYYRGQPLAPELASHAAQAVPALIGRGEEHWRRFGRFEVESVLLAWLEGDPEVRARLASGGAGDAFPDVWVLAGAMEEAWAIVRRQLLTSGQYVELDDGELLSCDEYAELYARAVAAREEEERRDAYEHSLTYYLHLLQEEVSAYKDATASPSDAEPEVESGEEGAEWSDPVSALEWARPLRQALPRDLYGLEIRMTAQWHCVLVVWSLENPEDDTLTLSNSGQVVQLMEGLQEIAREQTQAPDKEEGEQDQTAILAADETGVRDQSGRAQAGTSVEGSSPHHHHTEWGPDG
jgi:hypothetical protein